MFLKILAGIISFASFTAAAYVLKIDLDIRKMIKKNREIFGEGE